MTIIPITRMATILPMAESQGLSVGQQGGTGIPFADVLGDAMKDVRETQAVSKQDAYDMAMGTSDNLAAVMINSAKAATAVEMAVQLTNRAVSAYKEIMQMQV